MSNITFWREKAEKVTTNQNDVAENRSTAGNTESAWGMTAFGHLGLGCLQDWVWKLVPCTVYIKEGFFHCQHLKIMKYYVEIWISNFS